LKKRVITKDEAEKLTDLDVFMGKIFRKSGETMSMRKIIEKCLA
jgi:hypothetical protein